MGFCLGGSDSWNQAAFGHRLSGCIGFYGQPQRTGPFLARLRAALLLLIAGADFTPAEAYSRFAAELSEAGVEFEPHTYPGAPHSFFDRTFAHHQEACADAWTRMLDLIARHRDSRAAT